MRERIQFAAKANWQLHDTGAGFFSSRSKLCGTHAQGEFLAFIESCARAGVLISEDAFSERTFSLDWPAASAIAQRMVPGFQSQGYCATYTTILIEQCVELCEVGTAPAHHWGTAGIAGLKEVCRTVALSDRMLDDVFPL